MYKIVDRFIFHHKRKICGACTQLSTYWTYSNVSIPLFYWYKLQKNWKECSDSQIWNGIWVLLFTAYISVGTSYFSSGFIIWKKKVEIIILWVMSTAQQVQKESKKNKWTKKILCSSSDAGMHSPLIHMWSVHRVVVHSGTFAICVLRVMRCLKIKSGGKPDKSFS